MTIYQDPAGAYLHPTLLPALMQVPAKMGQHQHENQATEVLAWLVDRSDVVARAVTKLFIGDAAEACQAKRIGARTQLSLARLGGSTVFPDLSIDGADGSFQVLVEVKISAELSESTDPSGGVTKQDAMYRNAWAAQGRAGQARLRAVGTLTREGGPRPFNRDAMEARDVSWSQLRAALADCGTATEVEFREVLLSFVEAIDVHIAVPKLDPASTSAWLSAHAPLAEETASLIAKCIGGTPDKSTTTTSDYASRYVRFTDTTGQEMRVRVYVTPAGGRMNLPGHPNSLAVYLGRDSNATLESSMVPRLQAAGFVSQKDIWGFRLCRRHYEIPVGGAQEQLPKSVAQQVVAMLRSARLADG